MELLNFTCKLPNSQLGPPLVTSLCRLVIIHSMASYVSRHSRKSVASHFWNFYLMQIMLSHTGNSRPSRPGRRSVANRLQSTTGQSEVGPKWLGRGCGFGTRVYGNRFTNGVRGSGDRKSVMVWSQVTFITWPIIHFFVYTYVSRCPTSM